MRDKGVVKIWAIPLIERSSINLQRNFFRNFSKKKWFQEILRDKYRKNSTTNKFNKILDLQRERQRRASETSQISPKEQEISL